MIGRVVSTKSKNTAVVLVQRTASHPLYKKTFIRTKRYLVDDPLNVKDGDIVEIINSKPVSKNKHWRIVKLIGKNIVEIAEEQMKKKADEIIAEVMPEDRLSVLGDQLSDSGQPVVSKSDKQKSEKPDSENRKQKTEN